MESYSSGLTAVKLLLHLTIIQIISNSCNSFLTWGLQDSARQADSDLESSMMPPVKGSDQRLQFRLRFQWPKLPEPHAKHWGNSEPREILWHLVTMGHKWWQISVSRSLWQKWLGRLENFWLESSWVNCPIATFCSKSTLEWATVVFNSSQTQTSKSAKQR